MDAVSGLPALTERSPADDVIMFLRQLTASLFCPIVHLSQQLLLEDAERKPQMHKRKSKGAESGEN